MHLLDLVGNTPLIELSKIAKDVPHVKLLAKAEFCNPSGSVKDRAARAMILDGIKKGRLTKDKTIVDATSGNTGISYAMIGAALGYKVRLYMPKNTSIERKIIIRNFGAEIIETNPLESSDGAYLAARAAVDAEPELYFYPDQYNNDANVNIHYNTTGVEIWEQSEHKVTHFLTGMGTSGTFVGVSRRLKAYNSDIKTIAMQPNTPFHGIEGTKHMISTIKPGIYDPHIADETIVTDTDSAYEMARRLAREEGIFVGISSGANISAALKLAETLPDNSVIVTILCDSGTRYLSDSFWEDER